MIREEHEQWGRRVGRWDTTELHPSELVVAIITHKQWLAVLVKAYPCRMTELHCFAVPICEAFLHPSKRWDISFYCHQQQAKYDEQVFTHTPCGVMFRIKWSLQSLTKTSPVCWLIAIPYGSWKLALEPTPSELPRCPLPIKALIVPAWVRELTIMLHKKLGRKEEGEKKRWVYTWRCDLCDGMCTVRSHIKAVVFVVHCYIIWTFHLILLNECCHITWRYDQICFQ